MKRWDVIHEYWVMVGEEPEPDWDTLGCFPSLEAARAAAPDLARRHDLDAVSILEWTGGTGQKVEEVKR